jgi:pimeloyl-ACP methyl ester carboxylesterase
MNSEGPPEARGREHFTRQVEVVIPALLRHLSISCPILYGHSEGAAIAMLYAATSKQLEALILESPYVVPGEQADAFIEKMAAEYPGSKLQERLGQYQLEPDAVSYSWAHWVSTQEDISAIHDLLPQIACPVLVLQGADDAFGVTKHLQALQAVLPDLQYETFANTGHLPHREQAELLLDRISRFLNGMQLASPCRS